METNFKYMKLWKRSGIKLVCFCLVIITLVVGCGTRNTGKSIIKIKHDTLNVNNNIELKQNSVFNDILEAKPIDNTKPIIINGISYYNASLLFDKSIKKGIEIKGNTNLSQSSIDKIEIEKKTESKNHNFIWIGISFILILFIFLWFYLPRF